MVSEQGTFVLSIEAQNNIDLMCQEGDPIVDTNNRFENPAYKSYQMRNMRTSSIVVDRKVFADLPVISKCLPEVKPVASEPS